MDKFIKAAPLELAFRIDRKATKEQVQEEISRPVTAKGKPWRDKILLVIMFAFAFSRCDAQFEKEVDSLQMKYENEMTVYSLGHFMADSIRWHKMILPDNINADAPKAIFYLILTVNDTTSYYQSSGGRNNFLWTLHDIQRKVDGNKTHFLIKVTWTYWDYKSRGDSEYYILGEFSISPAVGEKHRNGDNGFAFELRKRR